MIRDPGAQPQRTSVAWQRTLLAAVVTIALLARHPKAAVHVTAAAALAVALLGALVRHRTSVLAKGPAPIQSSPAMLRLTALLCLGIAAMSVSCVIPM